MSILKANSLQKLDGTSHKGFAEYAVIADQKSSGTNGGTFLNGDWRTRDLNTELIDADSIVSIASNQFVLGAGTYLIAAEAPAFDVTHHAIRIYNVTGTSVLATGTNANCSGVITTSKAFARIVLTGSTTFEIQHQCAQTKADTGFGTSNSFGTNTYTVVEIYKEG